MHLAQTERRVLLKRLMDENDILRNRNSFLEREVKVLQDAVTYNWGLIEARAEKDEKITRVILENRRLKKLRKGGGTHGRNGNARLP